MHTLNEMTSHDEMTVGHPYEDTPEYALHGANGHSNYVDQHDFYLPSSVLIDGKFQPQYSASHKLYSGRGSHFYSGNCRTAQCTPFRISLSLSFPQHLQLTASGRVTNEHH